MPDPPFPHTIRNRFPLPGLIKLDSPLPTPKRGTFGLYAGGNAGQIPAHVAEDRGSKGSRTLPASS